MPLQIVPRDISIKDSVYLDSFSKIRVSEVSHGCAIDFNYGVNTDPKVKLNISSAGFQPSITFNSTDKAAVFNKTTATTGNQTIGITSANPLNFKAGSTFKGYISFKILNLSALSNALDVGSVGFGGNGANAVEQLENGSYSLVFNSTGYALRIVNTTFGSANVTTVIRSSWADKLDGTGPSGITIDFTKPQIFFVRAETGRNGEITFGFVIEGEEISFYSFRMYDLSATANILNYASNFRPAVGLNQNAAAGSVTPIFEVYSMVASLEDDGEKSKFSEAAFSKTLTSGTLPAGVFTRIFSLRRLTGLGNFSNFIKIILKSLEVINTGTVPLYWELRAMESIPSGSYTTIDSNSYLEISTSIQTSASGYIAVLSGFVNSGEITTTDISRSIANSYPIDEISSSSPTQERGMSLWVTPVSSSTSVTCSIVLNYTELPL